MNTEIKLFGLKDMLSIAHSNRFAVGSFSPRYTKLIKPILLAAQSSSSPVIIQISEKEIFRHKVSIEDFSKEFFSVMNEDKITVPVTLHLDHTKDFEIIKEAINNGFSSVMIDASEKVFIDNVATTKEVVDYAHQNNVSVEAELGKIGTTDFVETDHNEESFTVPSEACEFCRLTNVDALAVSVGTAHGVYTTFQPRIAYDVLEKINSLTSTPLVLHGASGVPEQMVINAVTMESGGASKVNIATDIELEMLKIIGRSGHITEEELNACTAEQIAKSREAVYNLISDRINNYLLSAGKAVLYS